MRNEKIDIYEKLLNEKEEVEKESLLTHLEYMKIFGSLIVKEYELQIETIKYKKMISFCSKKRNYGEQINKLELEDYISNIMSSYESKLNELCITNKIAHGKTRVISDDEHIRIKNIYKMIVHMTHPDLHPELKDNKKISKLWNEAVMAYKSNKLEDLILIYDKIILLINKDNTAIIKNIDSKITLLKDEIEFIKCNEPYTYKALLKNKVKVKELKNKLNESIKSYSEYLNTLKDKMKEFNIICEA